MSSPVPNHRFHRLQKILCKIALVAGTGWVLGLIWYGLASTMAAAAAGIALVALLVIVARILIGHPARWPVLLSLPALAALLLSVLLPPRNDRTWVPEAAREPWAEISGDNATLHNYRNFEWHSATTASPRWETKKLRLSQLRAVDLGLVYWGSPHICHTLLSFDFGPDGVVCASVEARRQVGEKYSPIAGLFRKYELLYVLGDERDVLRLRTNLLGNDVYLFRLRATPEDARTLFLDYLKSANALREKPAWYHSIASNCTTIIRQHEKLLNHRVPWSWRIVANGHLDGYLYEQGYVARTLPLPELKQRSAITAAAQRAAIEEFSTAIRTDRPGF